ncbi:hypothetical protein PQX77_020502 [Marasmius sp. AFHP31]|nr:hypothetical protein PQX77_020502 [Marasmius sp. AFHP31]
MPASRPSSPTRAQVQATKSAESKHMGDAPAGPSEKHKKRKKKTDERHSRKTKRVRVETEETGWAGIKTLLEKDQKERRERDETYLEEMRKQSNLYEQQIADDRKFKDSFLAALLSLK